MDHIQKALEYSHRERDPRDNAETSLPRDESLHVPCIWAFEVFTPTLIANLWSGANRLGGATSSTGGPGEGFPDLIADWRLRASGGGWVNLGFIVNPEKYRPLSNARTAPLPTGIDAVHATILQPLPSTTILGCQCFLDKDASAALEAPFRETFATYAQDLGNGVTQFISVEHQRIQAVELIRAYLRAQCCEWLAGLFPGLFHSLGGANAIPTAELLMFTEQHEFEHLRSPSEAKSTMLRVLDLDTVVDIWKSDELAGLYLKLENGSQGASGRAVLFGNVNHALADKDLAGYGETREDKVVHWCQYLDHSFGAWILELAAEKYVAELATVRDGYGSLQFDAGATNVDNTKQLERAISRLARNAIPFAYELSQFCNSRGLFMHNIFEFESVHKWEKVQRRLFAESRERLMLLSDYIKDVEQQVRAIALQAGQIITAAANERVADTNLRLQRGIAWMTIAILILTALLAKKEIGEVVGSIEKAIVGYR